MKQDPSQEFILSTAEGFRTSFERKDIPAATYVNNQFIGEDMIAWITQGAGQRLRKARAEGKLNKDTSRSGVAFEIERGDSDVDKKPRQPFFGLTLVSCERGALRQSVDGVFIYDERGRTEVPCPEWSGPLKVELEDFYKSVTEDRPVLHDGKWGKATLEVCLAILHSSQNQREQLVVHQVPSPY